MRFKTIILVLFAMFAQTGLTWAAQPAPMISVAPRTLNFGKVPLGTANAAKMVTIKNSGKNPLVISGIAVTGADAAEFSQTNQCGAIQPGDSCPVNITFSPNLPFGNKTASLAVSFNAPKKALVNVKLLGQLPPPKISVSPKALNFGNVQLGNQSAIKTVTLKNTGASDLTVSSVKVSGKNAGDFNVNNHCSVVSSKKTCTVDVVFAPNDVASRKTASLDIASNDPQKQLMSINLSGQARTGTKTAEIGKFGHGAVIDDSGTIDCGATCSGKYQEGSSVTFTATPDVGWQLHHWTGCDTATGNTCTVTMDRDRKIYPTFNTIETTLKSNVVQLDDSTMSLLKNQSGSTLIFDISATRIAKLQPGEVILSTSNNGMARKVRSVTVLKDASIVVETENATLQDIIKDGTVVLNQALTRKNIRSAKPLLEGARLVDQPNAFKEIELALNSTVGPLTIEGSTKFTIQPDIVVAADLINGITEFKSAVILTNDSNLSLSSSTNVTLIDKEIPLYFFTFSPIVAGPVVFVPQLQVNLAVNGEAEASISAGVGFKETANIGVQYLKSTGWKPIRDFTKEFSANMPTLNSSVSLKGTVTAQIDVLVYGVAGPYANLNSYLEAKATSSQACVEWGLFLGVGASAGAKVSILGYDLAEYNADLFQSEWSIKNGNNGQCGDTEPPSTPQNLKAATISSSKIKLTWDKSTDNNFVKGYNISRDNAKIGSSSSNAFWDSHLEAGRTYCFRVTAFDNSNNESGASNEVCAATMAAGDTTPPSTPLNPRATTLSSNAIQLTWDTSTDDTNVAGYLIYRDSVPVAGSTDVNQYDLGLNRATKYCYRISAFDNAGNESIKSTETCATTNATGAWNISMGCYGTEPNLEINTDLNESITDMIQVTGTGKDYDGISLAYVLNGTYDKTTNVINASNTMTFEGSSCVRVDGFTAGLPTVDDVVMYQGKPCGCTAFIRIKKADGSSSVSKVNKTILNHSFWGRK